MYHFFLSFFCNYKEPCTQKEESCLHHEPFFPELFFFIRKSERPLSAFNEKQPFPKKGLLMLPAQRFRDAVLAVIYRLFFLCLLRRLMQSTIPAPAMLSMKYFAVSPTVSPVFAADVLFAGLPEALFLSAPFPGLEPLFCPGLFPPGICSGLSSGFCSGFCSGFSDSFSPHTAPTPSLYL